MDDPLDQTNQFNNEQNVEQSPAQLLSIQVDGEKKILSTATQEEAPPFAFAVYSQVDKEKRNEGKRNINESTPSLNPEPSFPVDKMYAQVDKKKAQKKSIPPQPCSQLEEPSSSIDQLYAQVDKRNKKRASKTLESTPPLEEPSSSIRRSAIFSSGQDKQEESK